MPESTQHKLDRVRPPRVQITYDVEVGGAIQTKELPFVAGILADLFGQQEPRQPLKERKFVQIDRDNFNEVLANVAPKLKLKVPNRLTEDGGNLSVELDFAHIDDFHPAQIVKRVEPLAKLLAARQKLIDLLAKLDGNDVLAERLQKMIGDMESLQQVRKALAAKSES